jgi:uncharacterized protein
MAVKGALRDDMRFVSLEAAIARAASGGKALTAFSGGVDSSLLLLAAVETLGADGVLAVTVDSPTVHFDDLNDARELAGILGCELMVVQGGEFLDPAFLANTAERCYLCKRKRYEVIKDIAASRGCSVVLDGAQADDDPSDRPGFRVLQELGIPAPLREAGLGKRAIRDLLRKAGYPHIASKEASACLATRIPTGVIITMDALHRVRKGEAFLRGLGFSPVRLRDHFPLARIALDDGGTRRLLSDPFLGKRIVEYLQSIEYSFVTLDLRPYR